METTTLAILCQVFIVMIAMDIKKRGRGRPRDFDREKALDAALTLFWQHGYDGTSMSDLTEAMGISPSSLYAAFGNKEQLYALTVDRYNTGPGGYGPRAWQEEPSARAAVERALREASHEHTRPGRPPGCLIALGAIFSAPASESVHRSLAGWRSEAIAYMKGRFEQARSLGEIPGWADPEEMAFFYFAILQGMAAQARDGAGQPQLEKIVNAAMRAWPKETA